MVDLAARHASMASEVEPRVLEVLRGGWYVGGPVREELEQRLAARNGRAHAVGVNSGTDALRIALQAAGVGPGDEVIVPAVSFFATLESVLQTGADAVVVDVLPDRPLLDPDAASEARSEKTRCVVPVHLFGDLADMPELGPDVLVVDDAAQAVVGTPPRSQGLLSAVSFYPTKILGAAGDGGLVLCDDPELAEAARLLSNHGMVAADDFRPLGSALCSNSRLDAVQAAVLLGSLEHIDARVARRRLIAAALDEVVGEGVVPRDPGSPVSVYALRHADRDALEARLAARGVQTRRYYPYTLAQLVPAFPQARATACPRAEAFRDEALCLPCHADLDDSQVDHLLGALAEVL